MSNSSTHHTVKIYATAATQDGIITRRQLMKAGLSSHMIDRRLRVGFIKRLHAGVYQVGPVRARYAAERAALLACAGGVITHATAARLHDLQSSRKNTDVIDVTLPPTRHAPERPGIRPHRRVITRDETCMVSGIPVTTVARTLLDLASIPDADVERAFACAENRDPRARQDLAQLIERHPRAPGIQRLRNLLDDDCGPAFTRSEAEQLFLALVRSAGLLKPAVNVRVEGREVDFFWPGIRLIVEIDGFEFHGSKRAFVRDRQRDSALFASGYRVTRLSWHQLTKDRDRTLAQLALALGPNTYGGDAGPDRPRAGRSRGRPVVNWS